MWHYACKKVKGDFDEDEYILVEYYPTLKAHADGEGAGVRVCGDSPSDLAKWLRQAADDVERYGAIDDRQA